MSSALYDLWLSAAVEDPDLPAELAGIAGDEAASTTAFTAT